jgi:hypothetical protein
MSTVPLVTPDVVPVACPALTRVEEVRRLIDAHHPGLSLEEPAPVMAARAGSEPDVGILPGRLLYLIRLGLALREPDAEKDACLTPDDLAPAVRLTSRSWAADSTPEEE